jgi:plasmid replication initiation protein
MKITELRECCGISAEQYKKFNNIKQKILDASKKEINAKTDLLIDYEEIKTSRKITSIKFIIKKNPDYGLTEFEKAQRTKSTIITKEMRSANAIIEQIIEYGFSRSMAKKFMQQGTEDEISDALKAVNIQFERCAVKNPRAMLKKAIQEKWKPEVYKNKKNI